ncbi:MAG: 4Fe-4S binding protein [Promethearchaeota archaeon]
MPEKVFYSPELTNLNFCHNCKICINACPVKALKKTVLDIEVDRKSCADYVLERDECIRCSAICPQGIIKLVPYVIDDDDGQVRRAESA